MRTNSDFEKYFKSMNPFQATVFDSYSSRVNNMISPTIMEERQLNVTQMDVFSRLMMDRIIFFGTEVTSETANIVSSQLLYLDQSDPGSDISLYINSPGGSVYDGLGVIDTMNYIESDVSTTCIGMAASMGSIFLVSGTKGKRFILPHSRVMIHQPMGGAQGQASDMEITVNEIKKLKDELYQILSNGSGQDIEKIYKDADRDYWMTAVEAKEYGIVDQILESKKKKTK